jgi:filamentous hemagglutinin family protein
VIPALLGQTRGSNLFHSFGLFNVLQGESATFTGPGSIHNIIGRVTGGQQSTINGRVISQIAGANLFLINPAGVLFGPFAQLDVSGSFHVSTADYLKFADGAKYHADLARDSVLTTAPVAAFGFLSHNPAGITIDQRLDDPTIPLTKRIEVSQGQTISLIGGLIDMTGAPFRTGEIMLPTVNAPSGRINLVSVASPGEVTLDTPGETNGIGLTGFTERGDIRLNKDVLIQTSSTQGNGTIVIRGKNLLMNNNSFIFSDTLGNVDGPPMGVDIDLSGKLALSNGARITSEVDFFNAGSAGDIVIRADRVEVSGVGDDNRASLIGSRLFPGTTGAGANIEIKTRELSVTNGGRISTETAGTGTAGEIRITAHTVDISGGGSLASSTLGAGQGGTIVVQGQSATAAAGNQTDGAGNATSVSISGKNSGIFSSAAASGAGGNIEIQGGRIALTEEAQIDAKSTGTGNAGNILIQADETLSIRNATVTTDAQSAQGGQIALGGHNLVEIIGGSQITTSVQSDAGDAGKITIAGHVARDTTGSTAFVTEAPANYIILDGKILATADQGRGGNIEIRASQAFLASPESETNVASQSGVSGTIDIQAPVTSLSGTLAPLPEAIVQAASLLRQSCAARFSAGKLSSLVVGSRDGLPWEPGVFMPSPLYRMERSPGSSIAAEGPGPEEKFVAALLLSAKPPFSLDWPCPK